MAAVYTAEEIIELTGARVAVGMVPDEAGEICTDTRNDLTGAWFVALVGHNFDGHDFIGDAFSAGALGCIVADRPSYPIAATSFPLLAVDDTEEALGILARNWRRRTRKKLILVAATDMAQVSPAAHSMYELLDVALSQTPAIMASSNDFSAPGVSEAPRRGPHLSTQFSLDPAAAFPASSPAVPLFCGEEQVQSVLSNWKINTSEILDRFLNLPDDVEYLVADFAPQPLDRAVWLVESLTPNALIVQADSFAFSRMSKDAPPASDLQKQLIAAVGRGKGQSFTDSRSLADSVEGVMFLAKVEGTSEESVDIYQPVLDVLDL